LKMSVGMVWQKNIGHFHQIYPKYINLNEDKPNMKTTHGRAPYKGMSDSGELLEVKQTGRQSQGFPDFLILEKGQITVIETKMQTLPTA